MTGCNVCIEIIHDVFKGAIKTTPAALGFYITLSLHHAC